MQGGYNIHPLIEALDNETLAPIAAKALSHTLLMFDNFYDVEEKAKAGNPHAKQIMQSRADAEWYLSRPELAERSPSPCSKSPAKPVTPMTFLRRRTPGRARTSRYALAMLKNEREGIVPDQRAASADQTDRAAEQERLPAGLRRRRVGTGFFP